MSAIQTQIVKLKLETVHIVLRDMPPAGGVVNDETGYVPLGYLSNKSSTLKRVTSY